MKTQIIQLDPQDDYAVASDKMSWGQSDRILLVWPARRSALHGKLDLQLLARHARTLGARLALVSREPEVIAAAADVGLPVFRTIRLAQRIPWEIAPESGLPAPARRPGPALAALKTARQVARTSRPPLSPVLRKGLLVAGLAAVASLVLVFVPRAEIILQPQTSSQSLTLDITADPSLTTYNLGGQLPLRYLTLTLEGRQSQLSTGQTAIPLAAATGTARFTNLTAEALTIPAGTFLRPTDPAAPRFFTQAEVTLDSTPGAEVDVAIEAEHPGAGGNIPAAGLAAIEGDLGLQVAVTNPEPTSGGREQSSRAAAVEDYDQLRLALLDALWGSALEEARNDPTIGLVLQATPNEYAVLEETFSLEPGQPGEELSLLLRVEFNVAYIPAQTLEAFAQAVLDATLPTGFAAQPATLSVSLVDVPTESSEGQFRAQALISRSLHSRLPAAEIAARLTGQPPSRAAEILTASYPLAAAPQIHIQPGGWPLLPFFPSLIQVNP